MARCVGTEILPTDTFKRGLGKFHFFHFFRFQKSRKFVQHHGEHYTCGTMTRRRGNAGIVTEDLAIHPADAAKKQITTGEVPIPAKVSGEVNPGILYTTFHFPEHLVNAVTNSECDQNTIYPEYKVVAVSGSARPWKRRPRSRRRLPRNEYIVRCHNSSQS